MRVTTAVIVLLVLAGCSSAPTLDSQTPADTVTPVDIPEDFAYAPGVTAEGVTEPSVLASAHTTALENSSYRLTVNRTVRYTNGSLHEQLLLDVQLATDRTYLSAAATRGPAAPVFLGRPPANGTYWSNGTTYIRKLTRDNQTTYNEFGVPSSGAGTWRYWTRTVPFGGRDATPQRFYESLFASVPVDVVGETTVDGQPAYQVVGDTVDATRFQTDVTAPRDLRLVATIRADGVVTSLSLRYSGDVNGEAVRVVRTVEYRDIGSTAVDRPAWFERAIEG